MSLLLRLYRDPDAQFIQGPRCSDYTGTQIPLDVLAAGQENAVMGLHEWPRYTHEEVIDSIKMLSLKHSLYCQDKYRVTFHHLNIY